MIVAIIDGALDTELYIGTIQYMSVPRMTSSTFAVLRTLLELEQEKSYGLELIKRTGLPSGTVYPILARLEDAEWIASRWEDSASRGPRKRLYWLTPEGVRRAQTAEAKLSPAAQAMANLLMRPNPNTTGEG